MGKNTETNLNGRTSKPDKLENGSACNDYSATRVGELPVDPIPSYGLPRTLSWLIADVSWLLFHLSAQQQRYLSGILTIFQMVPDTGKTAG